MHLKLAFRNLFRQKRRTLLTFVAILGGFTLASFSISWTEGTFEATTEIFTKTTVGHLQIHNGNYLDQPSIYKNIDDYDKVISEINKIKMIEGCSPRILTGCMASVGTHTAGVRLIGIDPNLENSSTSFNKRIVEGEALSSKASGQAVLGKSLADFLEAEIGDSVVILSQASDGSMANDIYVVCGLYSSGSDQADRAMMYIHIKDAQEVFVLDNKAHEILLILHSLNDIDKVAQLLNSKFAGTSLTVADWKEIAKPFYNSVQAKKNSQYFTYIILMSIVAIGILNTVVMNVLERTKEFGILKALGTNPRRIFWMIVTEVSMMSISAIIIGSALSTILVIIFSKIGITLPEPIEFGGVMVEEFRPRLMFKQYWLPTLIVYPMSLLAAIFPAIRAAKIQISKALRSV